MRISTERKAELFEGLLNRLRSDQNIMVGSSSRFNLSNINMIRKLHIIRDMDTKTIYCRKAEAAKEYIQPLNSDKIRLFSGGICRLCVKKWIKEEFEKLLQEEKDR
ncbi:hypothetical protein [Bacillus cytotoxicus]|uniref:hypothetical protein n=1 Tax=Bacillus cytotoxicus TaxID=580165 RepID=UPI0008641832|nr:hypothetical protein [Bacillus cytotoxicus]AWC30024.1 hypothetical protein CG483_017825 [Bacillus cytotoxicus]AWC42160.1 hypothetical protein CG480_017825 [Bacillus cytotoxicus]AWC50091.1 hypothetical protein CG478_017825 [Bacillus cytotoxicus]AWC54148.1 hypothetical protein CG477_018025 [Bacillus cytotoxicus]AWC58273.1 hypothetical protein CG476_018050 [Bacillus cytotoxicus]